MLIQTETLLIDIQAIYNKNDAVYVRITRLFPEPTHESPYGSFREYVNQTYDREQVDGH
ncbi:MAG: hypothetical protein ACLU4J_03190 [Butyricimonas paravirosa]